MADLLGAEEVAKIYDVNHFTIRRLGYAGKIPVYRCGKLVKYDPAEVRAYLRKQGQAEPVRPRPKAKGKLNP